MRTLMATILLARSLAPALAPAAEVRDHRDLPLPAATETQACITAVRAHEQVSDLVGQEDGLALTMTLPGAQEFADRWRRTLDLPPVQVSELVIWIQPARLTAIIAEIGIDGCMATTTLMTTDQFSWLLGSIPPARGPRA
jgi:hypothetical protein